MKKPKNNWYYKHLSYVGETIEQTKERLVKGIVVRGRYLHRKK